MPIFQKIISNGVIAPCPAVPFAANFCPENCVLCANGVGFGGASPLDLFKGHLTDGVFIPASRGLPPQFEPRNWFMRSSGYQFKDYHYVAKIQGFKAGGYEVTISRLELARVAACMDAVRTTGKRVEGERDEANVISSMNRSKKRVRHLIKSMGCDRLLTLTKRENNPDDFWTVKDWAAAWDRFNRLCKKMGVSLDYVAVLERHKKGNFHLHAAIVGHISVKHIRKIWLVCCGGGKGSGNVDIAYKKGVSDFQRRAGLAKYVSKYITKQMGFTEFNKKRYWSSKHKLPPVRRYILNADDLSAALFEFAAFWCLNPLVLFSTVFRFKLDTGAWFSYDDKLAAPPPF